MSDHISIEVTDSGLGGYVDLIVCPICAAALANVGHERSHIVWHEIIAALFAERSSKPSFNPETHCLDSGIRLRYDADENTPFVDNAGTEELLDRLEEKVKAVMVKSMADAILTDDTADLKAMNAGGGWVREVWLGGERPGDGFRVLENGDIVDGHYQNEMRRG